MFKKFRYLYVGLMLLAVSMCSVACDDDTVEFDEWSTTYVYLETESLDNAFSFHKYYNISDNAIEDPTPITFKCNVKIAKAQSSDIIVKLGSNAAEILGDAAASLTIPSEIVIKANTLNTEFEAVLSMDFLMSDAKANSYDLTFGLSGLETSIEGVSLSSKRNKASISVSKSLTLGNLIESGQPEGTPLSFEGWKVAFSAGWRGNMDIPIGATSGDLAKDGGATWLCWDMGEKRDVTGIATRAWASWASPYDINFAISDDNVDFVEMSATRVPTSETPAYRFTKPISCRYLKFYVLNSGTVSFTKMTVYEPTK